MKVSVQVRMPVDLHEAVKATAEKEDRSMNQVIVRCVRDGLETDAGKIEEAAKQK